MQDQLLKCQNCHNPFVYSVYEQIANQKQITAMPAGRQDVRSQMSDKDQKSTTYHLPSTIPKYCPICTSIKASEQKHPPKPKK